MKAGAALCARYSSLEPEPGALEDSFLVPETITSPDRIGVVVFRGATGTDMPCPYGRTFRVRAVRE